MDKLLREVVIMEKSKIISLVGMKRGYSANIGCIGQYTVLTPFEGSSVNNHCCGAAVQPYAYGCGSMASEEERQETGDSLNWCKTR